MFNQRASLLSSLFYQIGSDILITRDYRTRIKILKSGGTDEAHILL
ncbi:MAG: hypothetical protein LUC96_03515 [Alistipes sp.]|nr:hypothetical protein [Alistipes sp.]MCD8274043.1 hypothetical protein [Alistipes sp.]